MFDWLVNSSQGKFEFTSQVEVEEIDGPKILRVPTGVGEVNVEVGVMHKASDFASFLPCKLQC
jgi:hypothetical protein